MEENKKSGWKRGLILTLLFLGTGGIAFLGTVFYQGNTENMLRNVIMTMTGCGIVILSYRFCETNQLFVYENEGRYGRFTILFLLCLSAGIFFPFLPVTGWPFLVIFVLLSIFSNTVTGVMAGSVCLLLTIQYAGESYDIFWLYFIVGITGALLFSTIREEFKVGIPIVLSLLVLVLCLTANVILFANEKLSFAQFLIPAINAMLCCILLLVILKLFSSLVIHRYRDKYMELNDPQCQLLVQLKELSKEEYYHAIHTAYLSDRIAKRLSLDEAAVKTCGYYHRIGKLRGENSWENVSAICEEYNFPPKPRKLLQEYVDEKQKIVSKETIVVLFSDCVVSSILYLFAKTPKAEIDYKQLVDTIFQKKMGTSELWENEITLKEFYEMKKIFIEEKLYYDFLR